MNLISNHYKLDSHYFLFIFPYNTHIVTPWFTQKSSIVFKVRRNPPELVAPSSITPYQLKFLSDIDDQKSLRYHISIVQFYSYHPSMKGKDTVQIIRQAPAKTLVIYYPFAGRLRKGPNDKLMVDCNGEGVMFIEADADVTLDQFGIDPQPPFPCFDELLYNVFGSDGIINTPILLIQVTRVKCGGLILAVRFNHTMYDASGMLQFMKAISEIACGAAKPSVIPVWCRELLCARDPPRITCIHREYQQQQKQPPLDDSNKKNHDDRSFFFGPKEIDYSLRQLLPPKVAQSSTTFELLTACLWRCRTAALLSNNPAQHIRLLCIVNARFGRCRFKPPLPEGFYGNAIVFSAAVSTVRKLCSRPFGYALELVKNAKNEGTEEYVHSVADLMAIKGRPYLIKTGSFMVSDLSKSGFMGMDFGWGKALYSGVAKGGFGDMPGVTFYVPYTNSKGEHGRVVPICLPQDAMERFEKELHGILKVEAEDPLKLTSNL